VNILVVTHRLPFPPTRGGKIRPFHIIRYLARAHRVTVASLARSAQEAEAGAGLRAYCHRLLVDIISPTEALYRMLVRLPTPTPSSMGYFFSPRLLRRLRRLLREEHFDLVFVHCAFVAPYVAWVTGPAKFLDFGDMDSQKWLAYSRARRFPLTLGYALEAHKLRHAELRLARQFDLCTCTTPAELATLDGYGLGVATGWFPNGVDHEYFRPLDEPYDPNALVFVGRLDYFPNQQGIQAFCRRTWPLIKARRPQATLRIVGAAPSRAIRALRHLPGVTLIPDVADVRPHVGTAAASIAPLEIARGTQNKILESLALGVPAVVSPAAAQGLDAEPGRDFLVASTPEEFAAAVLRLLEDPEERQRLAAAGRARVLTHHSWERSLAELDRLIERCLALAGRRQPTRSHPVPAPVSSGPWTGAPL
jgi:hypothetical protein